MRRSIKALEEKLGHFPLNLLIHITGICVKIVALLTMKVKGNFIVMVTRILSFMILFV
jgi:hypothetical protein